MLKIIVGGIICGVLVFALTIAAQVMLPPGELGVRSLPDQDALLTVLNEQQLVSGIYQYPAVPDDVRTNSVARTQWESRMERGPRGFFSIKAVGARPAFPEFLGATSMSFMQLGIALVANIVAGVLAAFVLSRSSAGYFGRVIITTTLGLFAWVQVDVANWNRLSFSAEYVLAQAGVHVVSWLAAGIFLAFLVRPAMHAVSVK